ncbi:carboxymethylenebutenolidase homolog [Glandiceps talaboti]
METKTRPSLIITGLLFALVVVCVLIGLGLTIWERSPGIMVPPPCDAANKKDVFIIADATDINVNLDLSAYLVEPVGSCRGAVIVIHDIYGYELGATRLMADELATHGYTAIMPDLFRGNPWTGEGDYAEWRSSHPQERVDQDVQATLEYIHTNQSLKNIGVVGFEWGGRQVVLASGKFSNKIQVGVGFYGVPVDIMSSEVLAMQAPTMLIFAQSDTVVSLERVYLMREALKAANRLLGQPSADDSVLSGPAAFVAIIEGADNGFVHRVNSSDPVAADMAEDAKQDMYTWLKRYLPTEERIRKED